MTVNIFIRFLFAMCVGLCGLAHADSYRFNGTAVAGCSRTGSGSNVSYVCDTLNLSNYNDTVTILRGVPVTVNSSVTFGYNQAFSMDTQGSLTVNGDLDISNINPSLLSVTGGTLTANGGTFSIGAQAQTITADVSAAKMNIGTGSTTKITGNVTSTGTVAISSNVTIVGTLTGTAITTQSPVTITGDVSASTSFSLASGSTVSGNVVSPKIMLLDSEAYIGGNVSTADITLGWHGRVAKTITCTNGGGANCTCVTNNSGYVTGQSNGPVCKSATPAGSTGPDHIQINYSSTALTCMPQPVTLTACANAACTSKFTGGTSVTLTPGGQTFVVDSSGVNSSATVQSTSAGTYTITSTSSPAATASKKTVCVNAASASDTSCGITFSNAGFVLTLPNQLAKVATAISLQALTTDTKTQACVPTLKGQTKSITFACSYSNPATGNLSVRLGALSSVATSGLVCQSGGTAVNVLFDSNGVGSMATANEKLAMSYADVGRLSITASYNGTTAGDGSISAGSAFVIVAPASFGFSGITQPVKAGVAIPASVSALNAAKEVTPNFGQETTPENVTLSKTFGGPNFAPNTDMTKPTGKNPDMTGGLTAFSNGVATASNLTWPEVGLITLDVVTANTAGYLGSGLTANGTSGPLRFAPEHFDTAVVNGQRCSNASALVCVVSDLDKTDSSAANRYGTYVYSGQPFNLTVTARNLAGDITTNYSGQEATNTNYASDVTIYGWGGVSANSNVQNPPASPVGSTVAVIGVSPSGAKLPLKNFNRGVANALVSYTFPTAYVAKVDTAKLASPTVVLFRTSDNDNITSLRLAPLVTVEGHQTVLTGRLLVPNSYGSELLPLNILTQAQYWDSASNWITNVLDNTSSYTASYIGLSPYASKPCSPAVTAYAKTTTMSQGAGGLRLNPPGAPNNCAVDVTVSSPTYLPSTTGRARFGIYRSGPVTYIRETYY